MLNRIIKIWPEFTDKLSCFSRRREITAAVRLHEKPLFFRDEVMMSEKERQARIPDPRNQPDRPDEVVFSWNDELQAIIDLNFDYNLPDKEQELKEYIEKTEDSCSES